MAETIKMPQLGLTMEYGTVVEWLVEEGDEVTPEQEICEVETDKAMVGVETHHEGTIGQILVPPGKEVAVGTPICTILAPGETVADAPEPSPVRAAAPAPMPEPAPASPVPTAGGNGTAPALTEEARTASWKARTLAREQDLPLAEIEGSGPGGRIVAADVLHYLETAAPAGEGLPTPEPGVLASPVAIRLAATLGIDLAQVTGSGREGRVMQQDVLATAAHLIREGGSTGASPAAAPPAATRTVPLRGVRGIVSERMGESARATARVTLHREVDAGELVGFRERLAGHGHKVSYNDLLIYIAAAALREFPEANARLGQGEIELLDEIHVGLAVETERGLLVPVVHHADQLSLAEIAAETQRLIEAARAGRNHPDDLAGGTFSVTSLGMFGVDSFTPVINLPECCILGVGRIRRKPVVVDDHDTVAVRPRLTLSLVFDHRVIDGAPAGRFLQRLAELVEDPLLLLAG